MRKLLFIAIAILGFSAQAQHIEGATTLAEFPSTSGNDFTLMIMGTKDYVKESYVSAISRLEAGDFIVEPGHFYTVKVSDGFITEVSPFISNNGMAYRKLFNEYNKQAQLALSTL